VCTKAKEMSLEGMDGLSPTEAPHSLHQ